MSDNHIFKSAIVPCHSYIKAGKWSSVVAEAEGLIQKFPDQPHGYAWLFLAHWKLGDEVKANRQANEATKRFPNSVRIWEGRARLATFKQNWKLACMRWQECNDRFPNLIGAYAEGARANLRLGKIKEAQELIDLGSKKSPTNWHILTAQAVLYEDQLDWRMASTQWALVRNMFAKDVQAHQRQAGALYRLQNHLGVINVMIDLMKNNNNVRPYDYFMAARSLALGFLGFDLDSPATSNVFETLISQPLDSNNPSAVNEITKVLQSLSQTNNAKLLAITNYVQEQFYKENRVKNSAARLFAFSIGVSDLDLTDDEIAELISNSSQNKFCRIFSGYPFHKNNVRALKAYIAGKNEAKLLDELSDAGLRNLHLFGTAEGEVGNSPYKGISLHTDVPQIFERKYAPPLNRNKLRIAVCVSGQLRGYKAAFNSWKCLGLDSQDTHFFVHSWYNIGQKYPVPLHAHRSFSGKFLPVFKEASSSYGFPHIQNEYPTLFSLYKTGAIANEREVAQLYKTDRDRVVLEDDESGPFSSYMNSMKMYYKIYKSWEMMQDSGLDFDLVMRIRPDKQLTAKTNVDWADLHTIASTTPTMFTDMPLIAHFDVGLFVGDQLAISTPDLMAVYSETWSNELDEHGQVRDRSNFLHVHQKLAFTLYNAGIRTQQNPYIVPAPLFDPEKPDVATILALIKKDIDKREETALDEIFVSALNADIA